MATPLRTFTAFFQEEVRIRRAALPRCADIAIFPPRCLSRKKEAAIRALLRQRHESGQYVFRRRLIAAFARLIMQCAAYDKMPRALRRHLPAIWQRKARMLYACFDAASSSRRLLPRTAFARLLQK